MVDHEHGTEHDVNAVPVKDSVIVGHLPLAIQALRCSFSSLVATSFAESRERGGTVTVYAFLFFALPSPNDFLRGHSATPPAFNVTMLLIRKNCPHSRRLLGTGVYWSPAFNREF